MPPDCVETASLIDVSDHVVDGIAVGHDQWEVGHVDFGREFLVEDAPLGEIQRGPVGHLDR